MKGSIGGDSTRLLSKEVQKCVRYSGVPTIYQLIKGIGWLSRMIEDRWPYALVQIREQAVKTVTKDKVLNRIWAWSMQAKGSSWP
jgi:hypothetical protein